MKDFIKDLFHKHEINDKSSTFIIEYRHKLDSGKITKCPYSNCTKKYTVLRCSCFKELGREEGWNA